MVLEYISFPHHGSLADNRLGNRLSIFICKNLPMTFPALTKKISGLRSGQCWAYRYFWLGASSSRSTNGHHSSRIHLVPHKFSPFLLLDSLHIRLEKHTILLSNGKNLKYLQISNLHFFPRTIAVLSSNCITPTLPATTRISLFREWNSNHGSIMAKHLCQ